jgi:phage shock protein C
MDDQPPTEPTPPPSTEPIQPPSTSIESTPPPPAATPPAPVPASPAPPPLVRIQEGSMLSGVSTGLARRFSVDTTLVRIGWVLLALLTGIGLGLYLIMWTVMPDESGKRTWLPVIVLAVLCLAPLCCVFFSVPFAFIGNGR